MTSSTVIECKAETSTKNTNTASQEPVPNKNNCGAITENGQQLMFENGENNEYADKTITENAQLNAEDCEVTWSLFVKFLDRIFLCVNILFKFFAPLALSLNAIYD